MAVIEEYKVDYTQPLATLLKAATATAHETAEHSQGAGWLTRGELDKEEYVRFLMMLYHVYNTLEAALEKHSTHPALAPTYNPALLARAPSLASDISFLLDVPETTWQEHPIHKELQRTAPEPFTAYVSTIQYLADEAPDPSPLLAHSYVRYLGDLSGGQFIRRGIAKAYGVDREDGRGTQFYEFKQLGSTKPASIGDMRKIKEWFREGMNQGGGSDVSRKQAIAEEAVHVFELNGELFTLLRAPSKPSSKEPAEAPLGKPSPPPSPMPALNGSDKYSPLQLVPEPEQEESSYNLSSILTIILAASIAHFALTVGGFTGANGFAKLEAAQHWIEERISSMLG